jgi:hypothetical protein
MTMRISGAWKVIYHLLTVGLLARAIGVGPLTPADRAMLAKVSGRGRGHFDLEARAGRRQSM